MKSVNSNFLNSSVQLYKYYRILGEKTMGQLSDQQLFHRENDWDNSIAIIIGHLHGNMLSRWTDFTKSDGEKDWRNRDQEFEPYIETRQELELKWNEGWELVLKTLEALKEEDLVKKVYIRNMGHTTLEAINRQLAHYAYHIGQVVFYGKLLKGETWQSLSIPKGGSKDYNQEKFSTPKHDQHFTDEFVNRYD